MNAHASKDADIQGRHPTPRQQNCRSVVGKQFRINVTYGTKYLTNSAPTKSTNFSEPPHPHLQLKQIRLVRYPIDMNDSCETHE